MRTSPFKLATSRVSPPKLLPEIKSTVKSPVVAVPKRRPSQTRSSDLIELKLEQK